MVIYLPSQSAGDAPLLDELTPREIVGELDKYVVGQAEAKKSVAIAPTTTRLCAATIQSSRTRRWGCSSCW